MSFKSTRARNLGKELIVYMSTKIGQNLGVTSETASDPTATGGTISFYNGKTIHVFSAPGNFVVQSGFIKDVEYVVVAGGGGGSRSDSNVRHGGGGGAGGYRTGTETIGALSETTFAVEVGGGGAGCPASTPVAAPGSNGTPSSIAFSATITSAGGGGGARQASNGSAGGSGGGGGYFNGNGLGGAGNTPPVSPGQGNPGGQGAPGPGGQDVGGGGGGGAGGAGLSLIHI